ncbi:MAG TPA: hypothetical protein VFQ54_02050, partial [Thermomicrobiales bacterium]|nr:hypothetical protein [Thermomicrobiales bacterium]
MERRPNSHWRGTAAKRVLVSSALAGSLLLTVLDATGTAVGAAAQTASPSPAVATCSLDPVTLPLFDATPPGQIVAQSSPAASPSAGGVTRPASSAEQAELTSAIDVIVACMNTGNPAQIYGIFSDRYLAAMFADPAKAYLPAFEQSLAGPTIPEVPPYTLTSADDFSFLENGSAEL